MPDETLTLSVIIPVCNEAQTLDELCTRIFKVLEAQTIQRFELLFIDDGSTDQSWSTIQALQLQHPDHVKARRFRRNFGKAAALQAGFEAATGEAVITMDADLQDDPDEIPAFLDKIKEGNDCVSGWKQLRQDPISKTLPSRVFNFFASKLSGLHLHDFNCGFKAYTREAAKSLNIYGELHRYIPILLHAEGFHITEIPVKHHRRTFGVSKYGSKRLIKGGLDLLTVIVLTRYLQRPAHFFGGLGLLSGGFGFGILAWLSIQKLAFGASLGNRPLLQLGILLMILGVQLISTGLIGELIYYFSRKGKIGRGGSSLR